MPPSSRASRAKPIKKSEDSDDDHIPLYQGDSDGGDTEIDEPTPKPLRTASKKRLSDVHDLTFSLGGGTGAPPRPVNINDDAAEKRRRRKSAKLPPPDDPTLAGPSTSDATTSDPSRVPPTGRGDHQQLLSVEQDQPINVPLDIMNSNFEEWMKMATDNKFNAGNSWNIALIDYFHDMSLLRNNTDNSINFQRASFTLDGCVKIWTSRVDSVGTETGKLLSNLANEGRVGDNEGDEDGDGDGGDGTQQSKKRRHRPAATLAKDPSVLRSKKPDLGFRVDPLFKKTCADFDEGGAQGLLMNHLSLNVVSDGSLRVVFDASDSVGRGEDDEPLEEPPDDVDLSYLRKTFLPDLSILDEQAICHSLEGFSFSKDAFAFNDISVFRNDSAPTLDDDDEPVGFNDDFAGGDMADDGVPMDVDGHGGPAAEDFFVGDQAVNDDYMPEAFPASPSTGSEHAEGAEGMAVRGGSLRPFDPRGAPNERDLIMAMSNGNNDEGFMFDYIDQNVMKNWAGPEHWKLRKIVRKPDTTESAPKAKREKKEAFKIDFVAPPDREIKEIAKELFAPVTRGQGITLPRTSTSRKSKKGKERRKDKEEKRYDNTLPDDMHFSSKQLVTLFLKPKFSLRTRGQRDDRPEGEIDENFWAQAAADQAAGGATGDEPDLTQNGGAIPFNTQFFHDDYDDGPGFDDVDEGGPSVMGGDAGEQDLLADQTSRRRVRPEFVNYAKRAKRVDVRKLKDNIWRNLDIVVPDIKDDEDDEDVMDTSDRPPTDPTEPRVFDNVISGLKKSYPHDKMEEISTSFCFICLLHLANERGLKLETGTADQMDDEFGADEDKRVGNIWDLKVYRDPEATPAA